MKRSVTLLFCMVLLLSCKKESKAPVVDAPAKTGTVSLNVITYDSLGNKESDFSGVKVSLYNTSYNTTTDAGGKVVFNNVPYGTILPQLVKDGYDGPPLSIELNSPSVTADLPCAKHSTYKIQDFHGQRLNQDTIYISFNLNKPLPSGASCKVAILFGTSNISGDDFIKADTITVFSQATVNYNIAKLPNLLAGLETVKKDATFYICATPVSFGIYQSNLLYKQVLLGDNLFYPTNIIFNKNW